MTAHVVDAHHHLWRYTPETHAWIDPGSMGAIARDFSAADLEAEAAAVGVDAAVAVQAEQTVEETHALLAAAETSPLIAGVVGWAPLAAPDAGTQLETLRHPRLVGVRHIAQDEPDGFFAGAEFNAGVALLAEFGLVYDVLVYERQLDDAIALVDRHVEQRFVLDHVAKPRIAAGEVEPWRSRLTEIARRPNVWCKVSGMATEAGWTSWTPGTLRPYWDATLEAFGPKRLMFGSDWPVCLLATTYARWLDTVRGWASSLTPAEQACLFGGVAVTVYDLDLEAAPERSPA